MHRESVESQSTKDWNLRRRNNYVNVMFGIVVPLLVSQVGKFLLHNLEVGSCSDTEDLMPVVGGCRGSGSCRDEKIDNGGQERAHEQKFHLDMLMQSLRVNGYRESKLMGTFP